MWKGSASNPQIFAPRPNQKHHICGQASTPNSLHQVQISILEIRALSMDEKLGAAQY